MATLRADYLVVHVDQHSSGTANAIVADTTSCEVNFDAEFLPTTSQSSALNETGIGGLVSGTVTGSYLMATTGAQFANLFAKMNAGEVIGVTVKRNGTAFIDCDGVITNLQATGGLSNELSTGSYTIRLSGDPAV